jgi:hypothetical protein
MDAGARGPGWAALLLGAGAVVLCCGGPALVAGLGSGAAAVFAGRGHLGLLLPAAVAAGAAGLLLPLAGRMAWGDGLRSGDREGACCGTDGGAGHGPQPSAVDRMRAGRAWPGKAGGADGALAHADRGDDLHRL